MDETSLLGPRKVSTPDILEDVKKYCGEEVSNQFESLDRSDQDKLTLLAERLEFISHLRFLAKWLSKKKEILETRIQDSTETNVEYIELDGHDLTGVDYDIEALVFYLQMTCVDTIKGSTNYQDQFEWLTNNSSDLANKDKAAIMLLLEEHKKQYKEKFGLSRLFMNAFTIDLSENLQEELCQSLVIVKVEKRVEKRHVTQKSEEAWNAKDIQKNIKKIADAFWKMRSKYTHFSTRNFYPSVPFECIPDFDGRALDGYVILRIKSSRPLFDIMDDVIKHLIKVVILEPKINGPLLK